MVPNNPSDENYMWQVHGRAKWPTPVSFFGDCLRIYLLTYVQEQVYSQMKGRSIDAPCNVFGIGAVLYYMMTSRRIDDRVWNIGFGTDHPMTSHFGGDLISDPAVAQEEYSRTLIRTILRCLSYRPKDRITPLELAKICRAALLTTPAHIARMEHTLRYEVGDPGNAFEPQLPVEPNNYLPLDLAAPGRPYQPPPGHHDTLHARARKWLRSWWIYPDSERSLKAREDQRIEYERQAEAERQRLEAEAEAERQRREAEAEAESQRQEAERMRLHAKEDAELEEFMANIDRMKAERLAQSARRKAEINQGTPQLLLPPETNKRGRPPSPHDNINRKRSRPEGFGEAGSAEVPKTNKPIDRDAGLPDLDLQPQGRQPTSFQPPSPELGAARTAADEYDPSLPAFGPAPPAVAVPSKPPATPKEKDKRTEPVIWHVKEWKGKKMRADLLPEDFPWEEYVWWNSQLRERQSLTQKDREEYEILEKEGRVFLPAKPPPPKYFFGQISYDWLSPDEQREWDEEDKESAREQRANQERIREERAREERASLGLVNQLAGGAARDLSDNSTSGSRRAVQSNYKLGASSQRDDSDNATFGDSMNRPVEIDDKDEDDDARPPVGAGSRPPRKEADKSVSSRRTKAAEPRVAVASVPAKEKGPAKSKKKVKFYCPFCSNAGPWVRQFAAINHITKHHSGLGVPTTKKPSKAP